MNINRHLQKALAANANSSGFTAKTATLAGGTGVSAPNSSAILVASPETGGGFVPTWIRLYPYGLGSDNDVFSLRLWGWWHLGSGTDNNKMWMPSILTEISCTISAFTGYAGGLVLNTERFADTISLVANVGEYSITAVTTRIGTVQLFSPQNDTPACAQVPLRGCEYIEFDWDQTTGTPTTNCLYQLFDEINPCSCS